MKLTEDISIVIGNKDANFQSQIVLSDFKVLVRSCQTHEEYQRILNDDTGSSEGWLSLNFADVLLFNSEGQFSLAEFRIPEKNLQPKLSEKFKFRETHRGTPVIENLIPFILKPQKYRYFELDEGLLIAFSEPDFALDDLKELKLTKNVSFFFRDDLYVAWGIYQPELNLTQNYFENSAAFPSKFLKESFSQALKLIEDDNFYELEQKDIGLLKRIAKLYNEIAENQDMKMNPGLKTLNNWLFDICDRYYFGVDFEKYFD